MADRIKRYSSVTLPVGMLEFLDEVGVRMARGNAADVDSTEVNIPSRRKVFQDCVMLTLSELYPDLLREYRIMLEDSDALEVCSDVKKHIQRKQYSVA